MQLPKQWTFTKLPSLRQFFSPTWNIYRWQSFQFVIYSTERAVQWKRKPKLEKCLLGQAFGLGFKPPVRMPVAHTGVPKLAPDPSFPAVDQMEAAVRAQWRWAPTTHLGDLDWVPEFLSSRLPGFQPSLPTTPHPRCGYLRSEPDDTMLLLSLSNKWLKCLFIYCCSSPLCPDKQTCSVISYYTFITRDITKF